MSTPQQEADRMLAFWQVQAAMGIAPAQRLIPANSSEIDAYERELGAIREVLRGVQQ
jgi:hypothetical protein